MNSWSISSLDAPESPFAWLRPSELGVAIKGADELKLRDISAYLSMLGSHVFSTAVVAGKRADGVREIREISTGPSDGGYFSRVAWKLTFHTGNAQKLLFRPAQIDESFFSDARFLADSRWRTDLLTIQADQIPECLCECGQTYAVTTRVCPVCGGENPLGWALEIYADTLIPGLV